MSRKFLKTGSHIALQAMVMDVSEKGNTAAVELNLLSAGEPPQVINIDAPFMFAVWSKKNNMPVLSGVVYDPLG